MRVYLELLDGVRHHTYYLPLTTYFLPLTTYHLLLTTYHLPVTTYYLELLDEVWREAEQCGEVARREGEGLP